MHRLIFIIFSQFISVVYAEDVLVQINGSVMAQSCNVKSSDLTKNVIFGDITPQDFPSLGSTTISQEVLIGLENCTGNVNGMSYMFSGSGDNSNPELLKITGKLGASPQEVATGLAIEILDMNKNFVPLNQKQNLSKQIMASSYDFRFYLRYKSISSTVGAGDASSLLYLDFYYE